MSSAEELAELLSALRAGNMSLDEVADQFRRRKWPRSRRPVPRTDEERAAQWDPRPDVPGSVDDVMKAYDRRELTREQFRVLMHAAADAMNAEAREQQADDERT